MGPRRSAAALVLAISLVGYLIGGGAQLSLALFTDSENDPSRFTTAACFPPPDLIPPVVTNSVISKSSPYVPGYVRQGGAYYVYANATDVGCGVATVTADVSTVTTGQIAVVLAPGSFSIGGLSYNRRSAVLTASAPLAEGALAYTITATDGAANSVTQGGFSVIVDNTRPGGTDVQTANAGIAGTPGLGDTITYTLTEPIDPQSILAGWTGTATNVVVRISQSAGGDQVTIRNAANTAALPLGTVNLVGTDYVIATRDFAASSMLQAGNVITITLGTPSGAVGTQALGNNMVWTPSATATDRAGNACQITNATEAAPLDIDF